jgi:hypothetical protein
VAEGKIVSHGSFRGKCVCGRPACEVLGVRLEGMDGFMLSRLITSHEVPVPPARRLVLAIGGRRDMIYCL